MWGRQQRYYVTFGAGTLVALVALVVVSTLVLRLEVREARAQQEARRAERVRLALWRMDSWISPQVAREALRTPAEYDALPPAAGPAGGKGAPGAVEGEIRPAAPEPLPEPLPAPVECPLVLQHLQVQVTPTIGPLQLGDLDHPEATRGREAALHHLQGSMQVIQALPAVLSGQEWVAGRLAAPIPTPPQQVARVIDAQGQGSQQGGEQEESNEFLVRSQSLYMASNVGQMPVVEMDAEARVGPLVSLWLGSTPRSPGGLVFLRIVSVPGRQVLQGFLVDWQALREALLGRVPDLLPDARLVPLPPEHPTGDAEPVLPRLASIPVRLEIPPAPRPELPLVTPTRVTLGIAWLVSLLAGGMAALSLRASIRFGQGRSRFASAVTHELRTPLTTFQLYTEMLAEGMVTDPDERQEYLETLREESDRLAMVVENVLSYARLEEGRLAIRRQALPVRELLDRVRVPLERRAGEAKMPLEVLSGVADPGRTVTTDVEVVTQILLNLVDNACKHAPGDRVTLEATAVPDGLVLRVRDQGPGIPPGMRGRLFRPFERGAATGVPGLGLGLSLARGLALDLGGDLEHEDRPGSGACFGLRLPWAQGSAASGGVSSPPGLEPSPGGAQSSSAPSA